MTIIITGAGGFVGRHLVERLAASGARLVAIDAAAAPVPQGVRVVTGDIGSAAVRADAFRDGCSALVHLATVPGGAAEADPAQSRRINIDAMYDLLEMARDLGTRPRIVFASSIAVYGNPLPKGGVDDMTPLAPHMVYGGHKAMMEQAVAMMHNRGEIDGVTLRLSGILARPQGPSGMKSAFMSDLFHALRAGARFTVPVSAEATVWVQSVSRCADNLVHALRFDTASLPSTRAMTLPALRVRVGALVDEIAAQCGVSPEHVEYRPDEILEAAFGTQPALTTTAADRAGFSRDRDVADLVANALATLSQP